MRLTDRCLDPLSLRPRCAVEICFAKMRTKLVSSLDVWSNCCGGYSLDKLAVRLKLSRHIPLPAPPATSQVTKRGIADLALHNLLAIPHRELEHHQIGIIPYSLASRQRHEPGSFPLAR